MKKRYSEYVNYDYSLNDGWFNPQIGWDTKVFIDPILIKRTKIREFNNSYNKLVDFFTNSIRISNSNYPRKLINMVFSFDEVEEANLGFTYDGNSGSGLKGKTALKVLNNLDKYIKEGLFSVEDFAIISIFDKNVSGDRITDMILNVLKDEFITYSYNIAKKNGFPTKTTRIKGSFDFDEMRWKEVKAELPFVIDSNNKINFVILVPKEFLVTSLYNNDNNLIDWIYHNEYDYVKEVFDYNLKKELLKNKELIIEDIMKNRKIDTINRFIKNGDNHTSYDFDIDKEKENTIYESAKQLYHSAMEKETIEFSEKCSTLCLVEKLIDLLKESIIDNNGRTIIYDDKNTKFIKEIKITKLEQLLFQYFIEGGNYNLDISPETNSGHGPVDIKISNGSEKVIIENKLSTNTHLLECLDEEKQLHIYLKQEKCKDAFLIVFCNSEKDVEKIRKLNEKADILNKKYGYNIKVVDINCVKKGQHQKDKLTNTSKMSFLLNKHLLRMFYLT